jgi:methyl-accepting chemotaxis protein
MCYKCQKQGHIAKDCKNDTICARCAEKHETKDCPKRTTFCENCKSSSHGAWSIDCPIKIKAKINANHYTKQKQEFNIWKYRMENVNSKSSQITENTTAEREKPNLQDLREMIQVVLAEILPKTSVEQPKSKEIEQLRALINEQKEDSNRKFKELEEKSNERYDRLSKDYNELLTRHKHTLKEKNSEIENLRNQIKAISATRDKLQKTIDTKLSGIMANTTEMAPSKTRSRSSSGKKAHSQDLKA